MKIEACNTEQGSRLYGRHFDHTDPLISKISRESINALKAHFADQMSKDDWRLVRCVLVVTDGGGWQREREGCIWRQTARGLPLTFSAVLCAVLLPSSAAAAAQVVKLKKVFGVN
jgi:hypothetical protein